MRRRTLGDIERDPRNVDYDDLLDILRRHGCRVREGTRHGAFVNCGGRTLTVPRHSKIVKPVYVHLAIAATKGER